MMNSDHNSYDKMSSSSSKRCCGFKGLRLNSRRFSVHRLRSSFLYILRVLKRWRNSYNDCLRLLRRNLVRKRRTKAAAVGASSSYSVVRTMNHSNSFCSEAIADCLEFIKRNSVSIDDERNPMLKQD